MPHKDRQQRLDYHRRYNARTRPSPTPEVRRDAALPPYGRMVFSADGERVQCHACGQWRRALNGHLKIHGLDAASYKETYDLKRTASLWPPALQATHRAHALRRDLGARWRTGTPPIGVRERGLAPRLQTRVEASTQRKGVYTRGGQRTTQPDPPGED